MKKVIVVLAVLLALGVGAWWLNKEPANTPQPATETQQQPAEQTKTKSSNPKRKGKYVDYKPELIAQTSGDKLLFFHASWCPQCRELDADIVSQGVRDNLTIFKVDYDSNQALRQKYGVTIQTTVVRIDDKGELIKKYVAYDNPTLSAVMENLF